MRKEDMMKFIKIKNLSYGNIIPKDCWIGFGRHISKTGKGFWLTLSLPILFLTASQSMSCFGKYWQGWHRPVFRFRFGFGGYEIANYMVFHAKHRKYDEYVDESELLVKVYRSKFLSTLATSTDPIQIRVVEYERAIQ